jgi:hypothetical protein
MAQHGTKVGQLEQVQQAAAEACAAAERAFRIATRLAARTAGAVRP